jgi:hypothetical protein
VNITELLALAQQKRKQVEIHQTSHREVRHKAQELINVLGEILNDPQYMEALKTARPIYREHGYKIEGVLALKTPAYINRNDVLLITPDYLVTLDGKLYWQIVKTGGTDFASRSVGEGPQISLHEKLVETHLVEDKTPEQLRNEFLNPKANKRKKGWISKMVKSFLKSI